MKQSARSTAVLLLTALILAAGCSHRELPAAAGAGNPLRETASAAEPAVTGDPAEILTQAAKACIPLIDFSQLEEKGYLEPVDETYRGMLEAVAVSGVPAEAWDCDMKNHEALAAFVEDANAGKDARVLVLSIRSFGVFGELFESGDGGVTRTLMLADFTDPANVSIDPPFTVDSYELTEGGHFLYHAVHPELSEAAGGYCVTPHGEGNRELRRRYVDPVGYSAGGALTTDWDGKDLTSLNWEFLFETLTVYETGEWLGECYEPDPQDPMRVLVPAAEADSLLTRYFPVTEDTLHGLKRYDPARQAYSWAGFSGGGYSPTPEVTGSRRNEDGSLTLTVGALSLEFGQEYSSVAELTVMPQPDGSFRYLSCRTDSESGSWPND